METGSNGRGGPRWIRAGLAGLGGGLLVVMACEMVFWFGIAGVVEPTFVAGLVMSIPASLALLVGSYRLPTATVTADYYPRIGLLTVSGGAIFGAFSLLTGLAFLPDIIWALVGSVRWGVSWARESASSSAS